MRKLICILMITTLLLSSLTVFAGGIQPRIDCDHTYGTDDEVVRDQRTPCLLVVYTLKYCKECGKLVEKTSATYTYRHTWEEDMIDGKYHCVYCDATK